VNIVLNVLAYAAIPAGAILGGGILVALRPPGLKIRSGLQYFAAGLAFAAVTAGILSGMIHERKPFAALTGFAVGVALILLVQQLAETTKKETDEGEPKVANRSGPMSRPEVDVLIVGILVGVSFAAGARAGVILTVVLAIEALFLGLAAAVALGQTGASRAKIMSTCAALASLLLAGAGLGAIFLRYLPGAALEGLLSFGCAALIYLVFEELLAGAREDIETPSQMAMFFAGIIALLIGELVA